MKITRCGTIKLPAYLVTHYFVFCYNNVQISKQHAGFKFNAIKVNINNTGWTYSQLSCECLFLAVGLVSTSMLWNWLQNICQLRISDLSRSVLHIQLLFQPTLDTYSTVKQGYNSIDCYMFCSVFLSTCYQCLNVMSYGRQWMVGILLLPRNQ